MATRHASAVKAHRQTVKKQQRNRALRSRLRTTLKAIRAAVDSGDSSAANAALGQTVSMIDKLSGKGVIHDNAAARYKSRLAKRLARTADA